MESFFFRIHFHSQTKPPWPWPPGGAALALVESGSDFEGIELREDPDVFLQIFGRHYIIPTVSGFLPDSRYPDVLFWKNCRQIVAAKQRPFQPFLFVTTLFFCSPCLGLVSTLDLVELMMLNSRSQEILFANCGQIRRSSAAFAAVRHSSHFMISTIHFFWLRQSMVTCL